MTQREQVLAMLRQGPVTTAGFLDARLPRFSARIEELRKEGHHIASERVREGQWRYKLAGSSAAGIHPAPEATTDRLFTPPAVGHHHYDQER